MKKQLLTKMLLAVALLGVGSSAWADGIKRTLETQNYESATVTDWYSANDKTELIAGDATYGTYTRCSWNSGSGADRSAYKMAPSISGTGYTTADMTTHGYIVEFDMKIRSGSKKDKSRSQFIVTSTAPNGITVNSEYTGSDYLFSLSMAKFSDSDTYHTTWFVNDLANSTGETVTLTYSDWYHIKLVATASSVEYTITNNTTSAEVKSASKSVEAIPAMKGFYTLMGYNSGLLEFDNLEIYDYTSMLTLSKARGQDYRTVTATQLSMSIVESAISGGISKSGEYYIPSSDGENALTNENIAFYVKSSNGRQWRLSNSNISARGMYSPISGNNWVQVYNLQRGQIVKVNAESNVFAVYEGNLSPLTEYDNGYIRYYEATADGNASLTVPGYNFIYSIEVYNKVVPTTISAVDYSTMASDYDLDFSTFASSVKAYKATVSGSTITFTRVDQVPAGEGVLLHAVADLDANTVFNIPVTTGVTAWADEDNAFVRGTGAAVATGSGPYNYVLSTKSGVVGFYQANGETVPANKAYLQSATNAARVALNFDDDATGIGSVNSEEINVNHGIYDLQGRRVALPTKGLYITNGKKVIIR